MYGKHWASCTLWVLADPLKEHQSNRQSRKSWSKVKSVLKFRSTINGLFNLVAVFSHGEMIKEKATIFFRRVSEAFPACLFVMTRGSLEIITLEHWVVAFRTGAAAGLVMVFLSFVEPKAWLHNRYTTGALTGIATALADFVTHPASFSGEAIVTGLAAAGLCILYSFVVKN